MKHFLHWGSCSICGVVAALVFHAYGWEAWLATLVALGCALLMQWYDGLFS